MNKAIAAAATTSRISSAALLSLAIWSFLIGLAALAIMQMNAPDPVPTTAAGQEFSAERAFNHVRIIARTPHPLGTEAHDAVRDYLVSQLASLGLNPQIQSATGLHTGTRQTIIAATHDIVGRLPGTANSGAVMLMAHYDSVYRAPGAADDGAGVAAILESVRALRARPALRNDLIVLLTDGEESGLLGADAFASSHPWMKDLGMILNFEARGNRGPSLLFETSRNNGSLIKAVARSSPHPIGSSLLYSLYKLLPNDTDLTVFRPYNIPALNFAFGGNLEAYHSRLDTAGNLSAASLQHHGSYALSLAREFGMMDLGPIRKQNGDYVFFDLLGSNFITYGEGWVVPGQILVTILLTCSILLAIRRSEIRFMRFLLGLLPVALILIGAPAILSAAEWLLSRLLAGRMIVSDSPANTCLLIGLVLLSTCAVTLLLVIFRKRFSMEELSISGLLLVCLLSWILALMLPAGSYLLFWPLLLATVGLLLVELSKKGTQPGAQNFASIAATAVAVLFFAPMAYLLYVFLTLQLITAAAIGFLLGVFFIVCIPFINMGIPRNGSAAVVVILLIGALTMIVIGARSSVYSPEHPRHDSILYSLNADDHTALWISYDLSLDKWTSQFFPDKPVSRQPMPAYLAGSSRPVFSTPASLIDMSPPVADVRIEESQGGLRKIRMNLRSERNANALIVTFAQGVQPVSAKFGTRDIDIRQNSSPLTIVLLGMGGQATDLDLTVKAPSALSFWLIDRSFGLPVQTRPRPDAFIASEGSDVTLVCRKYSL